MRHRFRIDHGLGSQLHLFLLLPAYYLQAQFCLGTRRIAFTHSSPEVAPYSFNTIRLVETSEWLAPSPPYVALSHRWGGKIDSQLRKFNLQRMEDSILIADLPNNFRDAIEITRALHIRYLWIDTLCIIQDDDSEWEQESSNMGLIYANVICKLSATAAPNSGYGCFTSKDPFAGNCVLRRSGNTSPVVRSRFRDERCLDEFFDKMIDPGWIFQERVLAKRVLRFVDGLVLFECDSHRASEFHPDGVPCRLKANIRVDGKFHSLPDIRQAPLPDQRYILKNERRFTPTPQTIRPRRARLRTSYNTFYGVGPVRHSRCCRPQSTL